MSKTIKARIPEDMYHLAKAKIGNGNMSEFIRNQVRMYVEGGDTVEELRNEITAKEHELDVLRNKLAEIEKIASLKENYFEYDKAYGAIDRCYQKYGAVGENQITLFSTSFHCEKSKLYSYCEEQGIAVDNYFDSGDGYESWRF